jgi:tetratricopeptide (TPR) repeat protein
MKNKRPHKLTRPTPPPGRHLDPTGSPKKPALSAKRKWLFRFLAAFALPLFILAIAEISLRIAGAGFDPHFFKKIEISGKTYYAASDDFGRRFFPRSLVRIPDPAMVPATKAPDTYRIFIFGESAALGEPRPNYGVGTFLDVLLSERFPHAKFEIINTSMTAIDSHVILPIARESAGHGGDLWIIYMGNNEMVGPFGAATVFGVRAPSVWLVRAKLELQRLRLVQSVLDLSQKLRSKNGSANWQGMEMFMQSQVAPTDPRKQKVYRNFKSNLDDILKAGQKSGAKIILSTMAVNLKDCPPFGSVSGSSLPETSRAKYEELCRSGSNAESLGQFADAQSAFQQAAEICPDAAEPQFQLGTCLMHLTNSTVARAHFQSAVDNDTLPFRSDSTVNATIRDAAHRFSADSVTLCDAAEILGTNQPNGIPGEEIFYEHVHFNPNGNYALALAWAELVEKQLPADLKRDARPAWDSQSECEQLDGLTDWNRVSTLEMILRRVSSPPFSGQSGNVQQVARVKGEIEELKRRLTNEAAPKAQEIYSRALRRAPENYRLHENFAEFLEATQQLPLAIAERKKVCELVPYYYFPFYSLGVDLKDAGSFGEARDALLKAAALYPGQADVRLELGIVHGRQGEWEAARQDLELAGRLNPDEPRIPLFLGEVLWKLNRQNEAVSSLREAVKKAPTDWQPHYRLASDLAQLGDLSNAVSEYQEALRLNPTNVKSKLGLAAVQMTLGRKSDALRQVEEALQLEPNNQTALEFQRKARGM